MLAMLASVCVGNAFYKVKSITRVDIFGGIWYNSVIIGVECHHNSKVTGADGRFALSESACADNAFSRKSITGFIMDSMKSGRNSETLAGAVSFCQTTED